MKPAVFLDRDGVLIEEVGYLETLERLTFFPWTVDAVRALNRAGFPVVVVTNQSGVARGYFTEQTVHDVHRRISEALAAGGAAVDAYYHCPHHPDGTEPDYATMCDCRKPARGLIDRAASDLGIDPARSFVVGDRWSDVQLAQTIGARGILVRTGYGEMALARPEAGAVADAVADNLAAAVSWILRHR